MDHTKELETIMNQISELRARYREIRAKAPKSEVPDTVFQGPQGDVSLSSLFGSHRELILVYNMGSGCPYCSLWADEYNGIHRHLASKSAFVVSSPEAPEIQKAVEEKKGWNFPMVQSTQEFRKSMKFEDDQGNVSPGFSVFQLQDDGRILHHHHEFFGPGDFYCTAWNYLENLPSFDGNWHPRHNYPES